MTLTPDTARAWVDVDLGALVANARSLVTLTGTRLLPMVKANGYGLGAVEVAAAMERLDPWGYGVATVPEGAELRDLGVTRPVVVFTPLLEHELMGARSARLTPTLGFAAEIEVGQRGNCADQDHQHVNFHRGPHLLFCL